MELELLLTPTLLLLLTLLLVLLVFLLDGVRLDLLLLALFPLLLCCLSLGDWWWGWVC